jgi:hypothetical protein
MQAAPVTIARVIEPNLVNGHRYSYASIELLVHGLIIVGIVSVTYGSSLKPGEIYGSDAQLLGRTPGQAAHHAEIVLYRREWTILLEKLGQSFGRTLFDIIVQYAEPGDEGVTTDSLYACRITDVEMANDDGVAATTVRLAISPLEIRLGANQLSIELADFADYTMRVT